MYMKSYINKFLCFLCIIFITLFSSHYSVIASETVDINKSIERQQPRDDLDLSESADEFPILSKPVDKLPWDDDEDFLKAKKENNTDVLMGAFKTVLLDPGNGEEHNVHLCSKLLCGKVVKSGKVYSQNNTVGPYTKAKGFQSGPSYTVGKIVKTTGGGVCKVATTVYNVAVLSNLPIIQRHFHSMPVSYVPYGQDATVSYGYRDFMFKNSRSSPILIWSQAIGDTIYVAFYGNEPSPKVEWHHETLSVRKKTTIYRKNPKLPANTRNILKRGMDGKVVKSSITIYHLDGKVETKKMGISYYNPLPTIIEVDSQFKPN